VWALGVYVVAERWKGAEWSVRRLESSGTRIELDVLTALKFHPRAPFACGSCTSTEAAGAFAGQAKPGVDGRGSGKFGVTADGLVEESATGW